MLPEKPRMRSQTIFVLSLLGIIIFTAGFWIGQRDVLTNGPSILTTALDRAFGTTSLDPNLLKTIVDRIQEKHLNAPASEEDLLYGAAAGLVSGLGDPYSQFFPPAETEAFEEELSGTFDGVGIELGIRNDVLTVISPLTQSPAEKAGVLAGDVILAIDGDNAAAFSVDEAVAHIRGERGTTVTLTLARGAETFDLSITRDSIVVPSVEWEPVNLPDNAGMIAEIHLASFTRDTDREFDNRAQEILLQNPDGILLDLRNNPGGILDAAIDIAGHFVGEKVIVIEESGDGIRTEFSSNQPESFSGMLVVVLVNQGSASAAEILAGALQDYGAATLIGVQTFGKGTVQEFEGLAGGSSLKLTVAQWLTPKGRTIEAEGLTPDTVVEFTDQDYTDGNDPQRAAAMDYFTERLHTAE